MNHLPKTETEFAAAMKEQERKTIEAVLEAMAAEVENEEQGIDPETGYNHHARESYMYCYERMRAAIKEVGEQSNSKPA